MSEQPYSQRPEGMSTDLIVCAVCGRTCDWNDSTKRNEHSLQDQDGADHPAVPVKASELQHHNARCDFCNQDVPEGSIWTVPASDFPMPMIPTMSVGDWAACSTCVDLIRRDRWTALISRVVSLSPSALTTGVHKDWLKALYRKLAVHITGEPYQDPERRTRL